MVKVEPKHIDHLMNFYGAKCQSRNYTIDERVESVETFTIEQIVDRLQTSWYERLSLVKKVPNLCLKMSVMMNKMIL